MPTYTAGRDEAESRLDKHVRRTCRFLSLSAIYKYIRTGRIRINGKKKKPSFKISEGDEIYIDCDTSQLSSHQIDDTSVLNALYQSDYYRHNFCVLWEDEHFIACDKPAGIVVHPGSGHKRGATMIDMVKSYLLHSPGHTKNTTPSPVHRLDKETSGILLFARDKKSARDIHQHFRSQRMQKLYYALCHGHPPDYRGEITGRLQRTYTRNEGTVVTTSQNGKHARTTYETLQRYRDFSFLKLRISTGRTHQIRVHCAYLGCPLLNDSRYGDTSALPYDVSRSISSMLMLHAAELDFVHPVSKMPVHIESPLPARFVHARNTLASR